MMKPKRILFRAIVRLLEKMMLSHSFSNCKSINLSTEKLETDQHSDIVSIAFNNPNVVAHQIRLVKKHIRGSYTHIIADNSSKPEVRRRIQTICGENHIAYVSLPTNKLSIIGGSYSHACSLNWMYKHVISKREAAYWGFIDHDLFPVKSFSIEEKLASQAIYGLLREREKYWYLWSGLCFFRSSLTTTKKIDFIPIKVKGIYLDSGGGNWVSLYSKMDKDKLLFVPEQMENIREGDSRHGDKIEFLDDCWIHTINGSYWKKVDDKENLLDDLLKKY